MENGHRIKGFAWSRPLKLKQRLQLGLGTGDGDGCKTKDGDGDGDGDDGDGDGCITLCSFMFFCSILSSLVEFVVFLSLGLLLVSLHNRGHVLLKRQKTNVHCQHKFEYHKSSFLQVGSPLFSDSCQLYANIISSILL